jgi:hypothetical protein
LKPSFKRGKKLLDGKEIEAKHRLILYGSDGVSIYTATLWTDGTTSCNCPGWSFQHAKGGTCKHAKRAALLTATVDETGGPDRSISNATDKSSPGTTPFRRRTRSVDT